MLIVLFLLQTALLNTSIAETIHCRVLLNGWDEDDSELEGELVQMDQNQVLLQKPSAVILLERKYIKDMIFHTNLDLSEGTLKNHHVCDTLVTTTDENIPGVLLKISSHSVDFYLPHSRQVRRFHKQLLQRLVLPGADVALLF